MAVGQQPTVATSVEQREIRRVVLDEISNASGRHDIECVETPEHQEAVRYRLCGRSGFPNEIGFEVCPNAQSGTVGARTDSMLGVSGDRR